MVIVFFNINLGTLLYIFFGLRISTRGRPIILCALSRRFLINHTDSILLLPERLRNHVTCFINQKLDTKTLLSYNSCRVYTQVLITRFNTNLLII